MIESADDLLDLSLRELFSRLPCPMTQLVKRRERFDSALT